MHHYFVSYNVDFFRTRRVCATDANEAVQIAVELEQKNQKALRRTGYVIGDIDVIDSSRDGEATGLFRSNYTAKADENTEVRKPRLEDVN